MIRPGMAESDPAQSEFDFQRDPAFASLFPGEDRSIVSEHTGRHAPPGERSDEGVDHLGAEGDPPGVAGEVDPGMVVEKGSRSPPPIRRPAASG